MSSDQFFSFFNPKSIRNQCTGGGSNFGLLEPKQNFDKKFSKFAATFQQQQKDIVNIPNSPEKNHRLGYNGSRFQVVVFW